MKLADLIFDTGCRLCNGAVGEGVVCNQCRKSLTSAVSVRTRHFSVQGKNVEARYLFDYDNEVVKKLLFSLKRSGDKELFRFAARLYEMAVPQNFCGIVTCCPRRASSVRNYGFDQVAEPCKIMCKTNSSRLKFEKLLKRRGFTKEQKNLTEEQRKSNIKGKFRVTKKDIPKNILLVDDVVTTGNTVRECASEILNVNPEVKISFVFLASRD